MKILLVPALVIISGTSAIAQIKKGAVLLGGQLGFSSSSINSNDVNTVQQQSSKGFSITPALGKAVRENLVVGADISYVYSKYTITNSVLDKSNSYGIGFFVRKYKELGKGFYLFGQARAGGSYFKKDHIDHYTPQAVSTASKGYDIQLGVYPGVAYSASRRFQLEAGFNNLGYVRYSHSRQTPNTNLSASNTYNNFSLGSSLSDFAGFTVGFRVLLN